MIKIARIRLRDYLETWPGLVAQALTFANLFVPIAFGLHSQLIFLVQSSAIAAILVQSVTHAAPGRLPLLHSDSDAFKLRRSAQLSSVIVSILLAVVGLLTWGTFPGLGQVVAAAGAILFGQSMYVLRVAEYTRQLNYAFIMKARLAYAVTLVATTLIAALLRVDGMMFALCSSAAFAFGSLPIWRNPKVAIRATDAFRIGGLNGYLSEVRSSLPLALAYLLSGFSGQAGALLLPGVGELGAAWAIVLRIMGGLQTIGGQLVAPRIDVDVVRGLRELDAAGLGRGVRSGIGLGVTLGLLAVGGSIAAWMYSDVLTLTTAQELALAIGTVGFAGSMTAASVTARTLGLIGSPRTRLLWEVGRACAFVAIVLSVRGAFALVLAGVVGTAAFAVYAVLCVRAARHSIGRPRVMVRLT